MMHVLFALGLEDNQFIADHTVGIEQLRERVREYSPERVSSITGIPAETIVSLGERYARAKAAFIRVNYGLQRHAGGGMAVRTIACLPALTGNGNERAAEYSSRRAPTLPLTSVRSSARIFHRQCVRST